MSKIIFAEFLYTMLFYATIIVIQDNKICEAYQVIIGFLQEDQDEKFLFVNVV